MRFVRLGPIVALLGLFAGCADPPPPPPPPLYADPPPMDHPPGAATTALDRGVAYIKAEAWANAVPQFDTVLAADDTNAQAHYYRALALKNLKQLAGARTGFEKALELDAELTEARVHLGELLLLEDPPNPEKAVATLTPLLQAEPRAKDINELLAYAHYLLEQWNEAATHYTVVFELAPDKSVRYQLADTLFRAGRHDESVPHMQQLMNDFGTELKIVVQLSHRFGKAKAYTDCVKGFDTAIGLDPEHAPFYVHRGVCRHHLGNEKAARLDYTKAIQIDATFQPAHYYVGRSWLHEQRASMAVESFKIAVRLDPNSTIGKRAQAQLDKMRK